MKFVVAPQQMQWIECCNGRDSPDCCGGPCCDGKITFLSNLSIHLLNEEQPIQTGL